MRIKSKTYYIIYYPTHFTIWYTGTKWVYAIARKYNNTPLVKYTKKVNLNNIKGFQKNINVNNYKTKELSKEDLFLELL